MVYLINIRILPVSVLKSSNRSPLIRISRGCGSHKAFCRCNFAKMHANQFLGAASFAHFHVKRFYFSINGPQVRDVYLVILMSFRC